MEVKTYSGTTEREAIILAKQDLGDDILIVEMKRDQPLDPDSHVRHYTVTVALEELDESVTETAPPPAMETYTPRAAKPGPSGPGPGAVPPIVSLNEQEIAELFMLRKQLRSLKAGIRAADSAPFDEPFDLCYSLLLESGTPDHLAEEIVLQTVERLAGHVLPSKEAALAGIQADISGRFTKYEQAPASGQEIVVFVGPSGSGKTSLIVKLAAHRQVYRGRRLAIISTDTYRAGANAGLRSIAKILNAPIIEVRKAEDLPRALTNLSDYDVILVDTPGRSPLVKDALPELQTQLALLNPTDTVVVLSATMGIEELWLFMGLYKSMQPTGLAMTKLDETSKPGKLIGAADDPQLPLLYLTQGREVPGSLALDPGTAVIRRLPLTIE